MAKCRMLKILKEDCKLEITNGIINTVKPLVTKITISNNYRNYRVLTRDMVNDFTQTKRIDFYKSCQWSLES